MKLRLFITAIIFISCNVIFISCKDKQPDNENPIDISKFNTASSCAECHRSIYEEWQFSSHSKSTLQDNEFFRKMTEVYVSDSEGNNISDCLRCHNPAAYHTQQTNTENGLANEGITCDFCHKVYKVTKENNHYIPDYVVSNPEIDDATQVGPYDDADDKAHPVIYRSIFHETTPDLCLTCHEEQTNENSIGICVSGTEIRRGENFRSCQFCHMESPFSRPMADEGESRPSHLHYFEGVLTYDLYLNSRLQITDNASKSWDLLDLTYIGDVLELNVRNHWADHRLPEGPPWRICAIQVKALNNNNETIFENFSIDEGPITNMPESFVFARLLHDNSDEITFYPWRAQSVFMDNRLFSGEEYFEKYGENLSLEIPVPRNQVKYIEVKFLLYMAAPNLVQELELSEKEFSAPIVLEEQRFAIPEGSDSFVYPGDGNVMDY